MAWIAEIEPEKAEGDLKTLYDEVLKKRGKIANIYKVHSLFPKSLQAHLDLYMTLMFSPGKFSRRERELVAVTVSWKNKCAYCTLHHIEALSKYLKDPHLLQQIKENPMQAPLSPREKAMVSFAIALTENPSGMTEKDVESLKKIGLTDQEILHAVLIIAYFNFVNRIVLGLGVPYSEEEIRGYK